MISEGCTGKQSLLLQEAYGKRKQNVIKVHAFWCFIQQSLDSKT
jgi:hypothetical protein